MNLNGANQALRGYRRRTLYALSRILEVKDEAEAFQLELYEDFAIIDGNDRPREIVQVKDYSKDLGLSDLRDFFKRSSTQLKSDPDAVIKVVSFGSVGWQLIKAWREDNKEREQIRNKLVEPKAEKAAKLTRAEVDSVFAAFEIIEVEENVLEEKVFDFLRETLVGGAPEHAFELLQFWLLRLSEKSALVTYNELLNRLTNVGKYLREREAYYQEWFTSIKPLEDILR